MKILVAEDQPLIQHLHRRLLAQWGFEHDIAVDGVEAIEYACANDGRYDLAIMDVDMPRMNGIDAVAAIRRAVAYFPILSLTTDAGYRQRCLQAGADEFALKPLTPVELQAKIRELTVKRAVASIKNAKVTICQERPMNPKQLEELRELEKKGLAVLIVESGTQRFVVHKNIQNKMSHVLVGEGKELFEFLDRGENPANCHLYKSNMQTNRLLLTPEEYQRRLEQEDGDIANYQSVVSEAFATDKKE